MGHLLRLFGTAVSCAALAHMFYCYLVLGRYLRMLDRDYAVAVTTFWIVLFFLTTQVTWFRSTLELVPEDRPEDLMMCGRGRKIRTRRGMRETIGVTTSEITTSGVPTTIVPGELPRPLVSRPLTRSNCNSFGRNVNPRSYYVEDSPRLSPRSL